MRSRVPARQHSTAMVRRRNLEQSAEDLLRLIRESLRSGHNRVAIQRIFMLDRLQGGVPDDLASVLDDGVSRLSAREIRRMRQAADAWVSMLGVRAW
jgi:hypothetical protein